MGDARGRRPWRWVAGGIGAVFIAVVAYAGWLLWDASRNLAAAADDATAIKSAALSDKPEQATAALKRFGDHAGAAAGATGSPLWSLMTHLPVIGDDARGVRTVSQVGDDLARGGLGDLTGAVDDIDAVIPDRGGVDIARIEGLKQPVAQSDAALAKAQAALDAQDPSGFIESLKLRYRDLQSQVDQAAHAMDVADKALQVLPQMLGSDGPKNYLLVMQNNAEIRATGGMPGALALLHAEHGKITMTRQMTPGDFPEERAPVLPLEPGEQKVFGKNLGANFQDANLTPDFARSAELWRAHWDRTQPEKIDGVISTDTVALSYLLQATGPVDVDGVHLTSANVVSELLNGVYQRVADPLQQNVFFGKVAEAVFGRVTSFAGSKQALLSGLGRAVNEHRILVHDFAQPIQDVIADTTIAGATTTSDKTDPQVGVYFADATLSKMSYYMRYKTHVVATSCTRGVQTLSGHLTLTSTAPADAKTTLSPSVTGINLPKASRGDIFVAVYVYAPPGGGASKFDANGVDFSQFASEVDGRKVIGTWVFLEPGQSKDLSWTMASGSGQTGDVSVSVTPSVVPGRASVSAPTACR